MTLQVDRWRIMQMTGSQRWPVWVPRGKHPPLDPVRALRAEKYESYVDLEPGVWTRYRIVVEKTKARLYVNGASQPCLIVNDLKLSDSSGGVALWIGPGTEGYFACLKVEAAK